MEKKIKYNSLSSIRLESKVIQKRADQWCKDNGYPIIKRRYVYRDKWELKR